MSARPAWVGLGLPDESSAPASLASRSDDGSFDGVNDHLRRELAARGGESTTLRLGSEAAASVDAYIEYRRIVGDADGGVLFSDEEYARFRAAALSERSANRIYVVWRSAAGIDCKNVGPATACECGHRYRDHATDSLSGQRHPKDVRCRTKGCRCDRFTYLPSAGAWAAKCACKHSSTAHDPRTHVCTTPRCGCTAFAATFSCGCGAPWSSHATVVETRDEREASGRPVVNLLGGGAGYEALGGLTNFASLADGYAVAAIGLGAELVPPPAAPRLRASEQPASAATRLRGEGAAGMVPDSSVQMAGGALSRLKASRAAARSHAVTTTDGAAGPAVPPPPSPPPGRVAETYAEKRAAAAQRASEIAASRRAEAAAEEAKAIAELPELEQLHRLSLARDRAARR